jgi:hypothetical protein
MYSNHNHHGSSNNNNNSSSNKTTGTTWWISLFQSINLHHLMFFMGASLFLYLPLIICGIGTMAAMIPGISAYTQYREDVVAVVLPTLLFLGTCAHVSTVATRYIVPASMQPRMLVSAFVLHAGKSAAYMFSCFLFFFC